MSQQKIKYICPLITVSDMQRSRTFYEKVLDQKVRTDFGENISFGGFAIHLKSHYKGLINKDIRSRGNSFELYFEYDDVDQIVKTLKKHHVEFVHDLREQPWKQLVVRFYDPDGNIIEIGESMENVVFRLSKKKLSVEEIAKETFLPVRFITRVLAKSNR